MAQPFRASLHTVVGTVPITAIQGATIVSEISGKLERWVATKRPDCVVVPGIQDVSILRGGSVWWCRGHAVPAARVVTAVGTLLAALLDQTTAHRTPAGLLYIVARATDPRHPAPFADLGEFHKTLARYAASRPTIAIDSLVARFAIACSGVPPLGSESTVSDVRRLRRAGGVPLAQIAADTAIPISLLRELEWGIYTHWDLDHSRGALELYAERAGLDGDAVARVIEHEQAFVLTSAFPGNVGAANLTPDAGPPERRSVPFALAAILLGAVVLAAPGDRSPGDRSPQLRSIRAEAHEAPAPLRPALAVPVSDQLMTTGSRPQITPAVHPLPRRSRAATGPVRRRFPAAHRPEHPLTRLARAIAGNGRYTVEPFPRVREEK